MCAVLETVQNSRCPFLQFTVYPTPPSIDNTPFYDNNSVPDSQQLVFFRKVAQQRRAITQEVACVCFHQSYRMATAVGGGALTSDATQNRQLVLYRWKYTCYLPVNLCSFVTDSPGILQCTSLVITMVEEFRSEKNSEEEGL